MLRITAGGRALEGGNMNISSQPPPVLEEAQVSALPAAPSGWDESSRVGRIDCKLNMPVFWE